MIREVCPPKAKTESSTRFQWTGNREVRVLHLGVVPWKPPRWMRGRAVGWYARDMGEDRMLRRFGGGAGAVVLGVFHAPRKCCCRCVVTSRVGVVRRVVRMTRERGDAVRCGAVLGEMSPVSLRVRVMLGASLVSCSIGAGINAKPRCARQVDCATDGCTTWRGSIWKQRSPRHLSNPGGMGR